MATLHEDIIGGRGYGYGGCGDGFGGGGLGALLLLALLGGRGFGALGGAVGPVGVDGLNNLQGAIDTNAILSKLATIEGSVPLSESQMQLALAGVNSSLTNSINNSALLTINGISDLKLGQAMQTATLQKEICDVDTNVDRQSCAIQTAIHSDGEATRALIVSNRIADLEQQLTVAQLRESEQRTINREQVNSHNTTVTVNQMQAQQQLQTQRTEFLLNQLLSGFGQFARATNSQVVVGSTGVAGTQTANPTNVAA